MRLLAQHSAGFDPGVAWAEETSIARGTSRLFEQVTARRSSPHTGRSHDFTRLLCPEWVNVIAFTPAEEGGELLAVEQFRHGIDASTFEVVGGICDPGEDPFDSARRELREETGHVSDRWISLGHCHPNPAVQDNRCHFFLALDCRSTGPLELDPAEELRVWAIPWLEWADMMKGGTVDHALVLVAFFRLFQWDGWGALRASLERSGSSPS